MGLFDWLNAPLDISGGGDGINNLGLIGATLRDVGSSLNGQTPSALDSFYTSAQGGRSNEPAVSGFAASDFNNLGLIGAMLRDVGASLNGNDPSALDTFYTRARRMDAQRRNAIGRGTDASYRPGFRTYG